MSASLSPRSHFAFDALGAPAMRLTRKSHKFPTLSQGAGTRGETSSGAVQRARARDRGTRLEPVLAPRTMGALRHARDYTRPPPGYV